MEIQCYFSSLRFPFLTQRLKTMHHLVKNRARFLDMYQKLLEIAVGESSSEACLIDTFEYIRMSTDDILRLTEHVENDEYVDHPLDSIALGILEARSFLFNYDKSPEDQSKDSSGTKLQRSQSERRVKKDLGSSPPKKIPIPPKGPPKIEKQKSLPKNSKLSQNKFIFQSRYYITLFSGTGCQSAVVAPTVSIQISNYLIFCRAKDDAIVKETKQKKTPKSKVERDPNTPPVSAALVNGKYVTYTRVTRDLAVLFFTSADSLVRRFYLIKIIETYSEALYTALWQLGINTDIYGLNYHSVINDFQQHVLYGFMLGVLINMANTNPEEIDRLCNGDSKISKDSSIEDQESKFIPLTEERIKFLVDLMRDVAYYVESKDFELGLPITNFRRYHELWLMRADLEEEPEHANDNDGSSSGKAYEEYDDEYYEDD